VSLVIIGLLAIPLRSSAQPSTIHGFLTDASSGEALIGATVYDTRSNTGTITNKFGFYTFSTDLDSTRLVYSYAGYQPRQMRLNSSGDTTISIALRPKTLDEVKVTAAQDHIEEPRIGTTVVPVALMRKLPAIFGELDVMKVMQLLPGVQTGSEGSAALYVRGGSADQNLILLDGVATYNISHLYGFFSVFNSDAINHVELIKGGFPARYGGRLSSVIDVTMREGNQSQFQGQGSIGLISSGVLMEGPIVTNKSSFLVSARRSYLNLLHSNQLKNSNEGIDDSYAFYDLNAKVSVRLNQKSKLYISAYSGQDNAASSNREELRDSAGELTSAYNEKSSLGWGNNVAAIRWSYQITNKLFGTMMANYCRYRFALSSEVNHTSQASTGPETTFYQYQYQSGIEDYTARVDLESVSSTSHHFRFGGGITNHRFTPGVLAVRSDDSSYDGLIRNDRISASESSAYLEDEWKISPVVTINFGVHAALFNLPRKQYFSAQPRAVLQYRVTPSVMVKGSYSAMQQFIHLLTNAGIGIPTDLWVPATENIKPQSARQVTVGANKSFPDNGYEVTIDVYYKKMANVIEYKDGASYLSSEQDWQTKVETGRGETYGSEFFIQKKLGRLTGWLGYTLSWNFRHFNNLNNGIRFPYRYDRRHDGKVIISYQWNSKIQSGATWVYGTGNAVSLPLSTYYGYNVIEYQKADGSGVGIPFLHSVAHYEKRNDFRMRDYHRLDVSTTYTITGRRIKHLLNLSIYNAYARKNPFYLKFGFDTTGAKVLKQESLFPIIPSFAYTIRF
jgi:outer membrane cobalamin receptor